MKVKNILLRFGFTIVVFAVALGLVYGGVAFVKSINEIQRIEKTFPAGSPVALKNLDIKGNVSGYTGNNTVIILVIDKLGESHTITTDMNLLTKP